MISKAHSFQTVAVSTFCVVVVCKIHNKGIETSFWTVCESDMSYWTFKELSTLTKYTVLGRLPEEKSQLKRFGVSIHHDNTAV